MLTESSRSRDENKEGRVDQAELLTALRSLFTSGSSSSSSGPGQLTLLQQAAGQRPASATTTNRAAPAVDTRSSLIDDKSNPLQPPSDSSSSTEERLAAKIVERATSMGSFTAWAQAQSFKSARNRNEVLVLAQALDAFLKDNIEIESLGMEILCRRVAAVHLADQSSNWKLADAIQLPTVAASLLPQADLNQAVRTASSLARVEGSLRPRSSGYRRHTRGGGGGGGFSHGYVRQHRGSFTRGGFNRSVNTGRQQQNSGRAGSAGASNQ